MDILKTEAIPDAILNFQRYLKAIPLK